MNKSKLKILKFIRKKYDIKIITLKRNSKVFLGSWAIWDCIYVNQNVSTIVFIQTIFHELGHSFCYRNNIWTAYHCYNCTNNIKKLSKNEKRIIIKTALKAERWVDRWAEKEFKKYYPNKKWYKSYRAKYQVKYLYDKCLNKLKEDAGYRQP